MDNKQKFASLYLGQKVIDHPEYDDEGYFEINTITLDWLTDESEYRLILKSLSEITDEDMIHMKLLKNTMMIGIMNNEIPHFLNWIWGIFCFPQSTFKTID